MVTFLRIQKWFEQLTIKYFFLDDNNTTAFLSLNIYYFIYNRLWI